MKASNWVYIACSCLLLCSCDFKCSVGGNKEEVKTKPVSSNDNTPLTGAIIKNDIDIEATGVKLKEAYLTDENNNPLTENKTAVGEKIYVVIKMDTGWVKQDGKSFIGAAERISTKEGAVVVDAEDIFKEQTLTGMDADDSKMIRFSALITNPGTTSRDFVVRFRIWDKKGNGEVKGKYNFSLK